MDLIETIWDFFTATAEEQWQRLKTWAPAAFRALTMRLVRLGAYSTGIFLTLLAASMVLQRRAFLPWFGLLYLAVVAAVLCSRQTLHAAGLLLTVDVALDVLKASGPVSKERLLKLIKLDFEIDFEKLWRFALLQLVGRALFHVALVELLILLFFWIVPIWTHPELLGVLAFVGVIYALLATPFGLNSPLGRLRPFLLLLLLALMVFYAAPEVWRWMGEAVATFDSIEWDDPRVLALGLFLVGAGLVLPKLLASNQSQQSTSSHKGGSHHG